MPAFVSRDDVQALLARLAGDADREAVQARIRAGGGPIYTVDPGRPGSIVEVQDTGARRSGHLRGRRFVTVPSKTVVHARRKTARRK